MLRLMKYLKNYVKESILAPLFKMLEAGLELIVPLVITQIIDVGIANGDKPLQIETAKASIARPRANTKISITDIKNAPFAIMRQQRTIKKTHLPPDR